MSNKKSRAPKNATISKQREALYQNASPWVDKSIKEGFYLEAITLIESMITDRLESRLDSPHLDNLGPLIKQIETLDASPINLNIKELVETKLALWKGKRNESIHQMVKIQENINTTWIDRIVKNKEIAKEGHLLFKAIDKEVKRWTRRVKKAKTMKNDGASVGSIIESTSLSKEYIESL